MRTNVRLVLGAVLLIIGVLLPLGVYSVTESSLPVALKTVLSGILGAGFQIMTIPAVAIMGRENYDRIIRRVKRQAKGRVEHQALKPRVEIAPFRYYFGLVLFFVPIVPTYVMAYAPRWLADTSPARLWVNLAADFTFLISLFVLGGNFWDKLKALFVREARVVFPSHSGTNGK